MNTEQRARDMLARLAERGQTLSCAESCTGGWFAKRVVDIPGASAGFFGGVVSYVNAVKEKLLGVREETLAAHTAVSAPVAREMAEGVRRACGTDIGVSVTGLAGPGGGSEEIPVGRVFVGYADAHGSEAFAFTFGGDRTAVREAAVAAMFSVLLKKLS